MAAVLRQRYRVNARVALRYAHGWSQRQAAIEWNHRWPDEPKTVKNFSYWESWPSSTGHAPAFDNLVKLAQLYECAVSDLLADLPDYRHLDATASRPTRALLTGTSDAELVLPKGVAAWAAASSRLQPSSDNFAMVLMQYLRSLAPANHSVVVTSHDRDRIFNQLVQILTSWAHTMKRRELLRTLG